MNKDIKENTFTTIDEYIQQCPEEYQKTLMKLRQVIREAAPEATEKISYKMPTFFLYGNLVHFALFTNHIGFYPGPSGIEAFTEELSVYKGAKGSVRFPINEPLPFDLIRNMVVYRVKENETWAKEKGKK